MHLKSTSGIVQGAKVIIMLGRHAMLMMHPVYCFSQQRETMCERDEALTSAAAMGASVTHYLSVHDTASPLNHAQSSTYLNIPTLPGHHRCSRTTPPRLSHTLHSHLLIHNHRRDNQLSIFGIELEMV